MADEKDSVLSPKVPQASGGILGFIRGNFIRYPLVAILPSLVFLMMWLFVDPCLSLIVLPVVTVVLFWLFKMDKLLHQIALGALALLVASLLLTAINIAVLSDTSLVLDSEDQVLTGGIVTPYRGTTSTLYEFNVTVTSDANIVNTYVIVTRSSDMVPNNISMNLVSHSADNSTRNYSAKATVDNPINSFYFTTSTDGKWHTSYRADGPLSSDSVTLFTALAWNMLIWIFGYCFMQLLIMILFLRMSGKSKEAREKVMKDYMQKRDQAKTGKTAAKGSSTGEATAGAEDTFVCSECGADVRASAKFCPNCGEPFDDDEEGKTEADSEKKQ